jgi:uncharacterized protein (TIGR02246 family)
MRTVIVVATLTLAAPAFAQSRATDETAIRTRVTAFETAINKRDIAAVAALYAPDADLIVIDGPLATGRAAIQSATQRDWGTGSGTRRISLSTGIRFLGSDVAIVSTRAQFNEGPVKEDRGTWIAVRQAGNWLIAALRVLPAARQ